MKREGDERDSYLKQKEELTKCEEDVDRAWNEYIAALSKFVHKLYDVGIATGRLMMYEEIEDRDERVERE